MRLWPFGKRAAPTKQALAYAYNMGGRAAKAKFDAAQTNADNRNHWINADMKSAVAAANPGVRRTLRSRARYEVANNSIARGIVLTLANDVIGTGPRLQMLTDDEDLNTVVELQFARWAKRVDLAAKLRTMRMARAQDGEAFAMLVDNPAHGNGVQLDVKLLEADLIATPGFATHSGEIRTLTTPGTDGIVYDTAGNPTAYHVLHVHPGSSALLWDNKFNSVPASSMIHWYRVDRPGQTRGLPDILPALPLFAQLRRYTLAVISAAETAANLAIIMETTGTTESEPAEVDPMEEMDVVRNSAVFSPEGWKANQMKAEQPVTTYDSFRRAIVNEIGRCLNMPLNIALGNSEGYNFASGRLDHGTYFKSNDVDRGTCSITVLDPILESWTEEAILVHGFPPEKMTNAAHAWLYDGRAPTDPAKEAAADAINLANNSTTLRDIWARKGKDWQPQIMQRGRERTLETAQNVAAPGVVAQYPYGVDSAGYVTEDGD